jgi:hypothetical protein
MTVYHKSGYLKMELPMKQKYTLTLTCRELIFMTFGLFWLCVALFLAARYAEVSRRFNQVVDAKTLTFNIPSRPAVAGPTNLIAK